MSTSVQSETALRAAMERLLAGQPTRSSGKLTVAELAREAGLSLATTKRADAVLGEFRAGRAAIDPAHVRPADEALRDENRDLKRQLAQTRKQRAGEVRRLEHAIETLAQQVQALALDNDALRRRPANDNVTVIDRWAAP